MRYFWWLAGNHWTYNLLSLFTHAFLAWAAPICPPSFQFPKPEPSHSNPLSTVLPVEPTWPNTAAPRCLRPRFQDTLCPARGLALFLWKEAGSLYSLCTHTRGSAGCGRALWKPTFHQTPFGSEAASVPWWILLESRARSGESDICTCVLVYSLFNYTQSLKHLHDALKYNWPFLFNFICLLVFGDNPAKHFSKFNKVHTTINIGANDNRGQHFIQSIIIRLEAQIFQGIK